MQGHSPPSPLYLTPKRKRTFDPLLPDTPSPIRLRTTNLPTRPFLERELANQRSPRTTVAGHLQSLHLQEYGHIPKLEFDQPNVTARGASKPAPSSGTFNPNIILPSQTYSAPITPPPSSHGPPTAPQYSGIQDQSSNCTVEIPETPRLRPVSSPTPPPTAQKSQSSSRLSPTLWWNDDEITGHDPSDPTDDGYGINGVGFLPTPAIANARAERRKKQVADWKNREAREARQKRSDKRRRRDMSSASSCAGMDRSDPGLRADESRKVRFLEI